MKLIQEADNSSPDLSQESFETQNHIQYGAPRRLVCIRHGCSEAQQIRELVSAGVLSEMPTEFYETPDREIRLAPIGCEQALKTGTWLRRQYPLGFNRYYVSDYVRAQETAALISSSAKWHDAPWFIDERIGERSYGDLDDRIQSHRCFFQNRERDPIHVTPPNGESLRTLNSRTRDILDTACRELSGQDVIIIAHHESIQSIWSTIAHMNTETTRTFFASERGALSNCQVVEFSAEDPVTGEYDGHFKWVRSSCPQAGRYGSWIEIERETYTAEDLMRRLVEYPRLYFGETESYV